MALFYVFFGMFMENGGNTQFLENLWKFVKVTLMFIWVQGDISVLQCLVFIV